MEDAEKKAIAIKKIFRDIITEQMRTSFCEQAAIECSKAHVHLIIDNGGLEAGDYKFDYGDAYHKYESFWTDVLKFL